MERVDHMPWWVWFGLLNIETRKGALILLSASLTFTVICIPLSYYLDDWSWLAMMVPISLWYWLCIRWVDQHASWE